MGKAHADFTAQMIAGGRKPLEDRPRGRPGKEQRGAAGENWVPREGLQRIRQGPNRKQAGGQRGFPSKGGVRRNRGECIRYLEQLRLATPTLRGAEKTTLEGTVTASGGTWPAHSRDRQRGSQEGNTSDLPLRSCRGFQRLLCGHAWPESRGPGSSVV